MVTTANTHTEYTFFAFVPTGRVLGGFGNCYVTPLRTIMARPSSNHREEGAQFDIAVHFGASRAGCGNKIFERIHSTKTFFDSIVGCE